MEFIVVMCIIVASVQALEIGDLEQYGPFQIALRNGIIKCDHNRSLNLDVSGINVYFYDLDHNTVNFYSLNESAKSILSYNKLDKDKKFHFFTGGYKSPILGSVSKQIRHGFNNHPNSYLIIFDLSPYLNSNDGLIKSYERSVKYVYFIGKAIANMLIDLNKGGISSKNMHAIGHSLGSHILGHVGEIFFKSTRKKIKRMTGLDPAGPCFSNSLIQEQIRSGVAEYVEVYHCNAGGFGTTSVLADIDFFFNRNGKFQPNCNAPIIPDLIFSPKAARCSHETCVDIWAATVTNPSWYQARKCDSYKKYKDGQCSANEVTIAGFWNPGNATGIFYVDTTSFADHNDKVEPNESTESDRKIVKASLYSAAEWVTSSNIIYVYFLVIVLCVTDL